MALQRMAKRAWHEATPLHVCADNSMFIGSCALGRRWRSSARSWVCATWRG